MRKRLMNPPKGVKPTQLEFEAKLGEIVPNPVFSQCADQQVASGASLKEPIKRLFYQIGESPTWEILRDPSSFHEM